MFDIITPTGNFTETTVRLTTICVVTNIWQSKIKVKLHHHNIHSIHWSKGPSHQLMATRYNLTVSLFL